MSYRSQATSKDTVDNTLLVLDIKYFEYTFAIQMTFFKTADEAFLSLNAACTLFRCSRVHIGRQPFLNYQPPHLLWSVAEDVQNGGLGLHWYLPVSHTLTIASTMALGSEKLFRILHNSSNRRHRVRITCSGWVLVSVRPDKSGNYMELYIRKCKCIALTLYVQNYFEEVQSIFVSYLLDT